MVFELKPVTALVVTGGAESAAGRLKPAAKSIATRSRAALEPAKQGLLSISETMLDNRHGACKANVGRTSRSLQLSWQPIKPACANSPACPPRRAWCRCHD